MLAKTLRDWWRGQTHYYRFTEGRSLSEVTYRILVKLNSLDKIQSSRAGETRELSPHQFHLFPGLYGEPDATTILAGRGNNPFATVAETLWVYAGRNDIDTLGKWLPRAKDYSDDGKSWSSGYGPRLRSYGRARVDQVETILRRLAKKPDSRQAVITLWDPEADGVKENSKDYVCNILVHFLVRDGGLNLYVTTRSNDIIYGVAINVFEWCFLGRYVAGQLGLPFRHYYQTGSSLHLYDWKSGTAQRITRHPYRPLPAVKITAAPPAVTRLFPPQELQRQCNTIYQAAYTGTLAETFVKSLDGFPSYLADYVYALRAEGKLGGTGSEYLAELKGVRDVPLLFSLLDIGQRRRREALWLCKGFTDLWLNTNSEVAAARYLRGLYNALNESDHVQQKGNGHYAVRPTPGRSPVQSGGAARL
jgi:thymidylate synthase